MNFFDFFMQYIQHENKHINERIDRTLVIHGFLLTSYVLLGKLLAEANVNNVGAEVGYIFKGIIVLIAICGFQTSWSLQIGVRAAGDAIRSIKANFKMFSKKYNVYNDLLLPGLTGGGCEVAEKGGYKSVKMITDVLFWFWLILLCVSFP